MSRIQKYLLSISSGVLLSLGWSPLPFFPLLFLGFIPILWLEDELSESKHAAGKFFGFSYLALLVWNVCTTWWVGATYVGTQDISTLIAGMIANSANPLLMCIALVGFHRTKKRLGAGWGYTSLIAFWITFEFIHLRWDLTWPWLTLGNGFAHTPQVVQWYEYTGVFGGTLWILLMNILIWTMLKTFVSGRIYLFWKKILYATLALFFIPLCISLLMYFSYHEKGKEKNVVVVQPNIDPYLMKFDFSTLDQQLQTMLDLSAEGMDSTTDYVVWPETAIPQGIDVGNLQTDETVQKVKRFFAPHARVELITGINAYETYSFAKTSTARYALNAKVWFDDFNTAIQLDTSKKIPFYHKSKLVPGVEKMPYPKLFKFLESLTLKMGGTSGSLGEQDHREVFFSHDSTGVAPLICYESIYGEYCNEYIDSGANLMFVITNDGWWENTAGHKQHLEYASLRAIEERRDIAQSANTGTSAFINQRGDISQPTEWWKPTFIKATLHANTGKTFYVRFGDYIGRIANIFTVLLIIATFVQRFRRKSLKD